MNILSIFHCVALAAPPIYEVSQVHIALTSNDSSILVQWAVE